MPHRSAASFTPLSAHLPSRTHRGRGTAVVPRRAWRSCTSGIVTFITGQDISQGGSDEGLPIISPPSTKC
jgi:hypothetical protein